MDDRNPTSDRLRRLASRYEAGVGRGRAEQIAARAITRAHRRTSVGRRLAVAVSSSAFLLVSMTGVGVAADRAVPGDVLYPLDRALEALGFSSDLVEERLLEAITLAERGDMALAIETANEALAELGRSGVNATLPVIAPDTATLTAETVEPESTTTTELGVPETTVTASDEADAVADAAGDATVEAAEAAVAPVEALRLAAEQLLQSVRSAKTEGGTSDDVTTAAIFLAEATASVTEIQMSVDTSTTTSSSTTTPSSTTTTTAPEEPRPGNRNGNDDESGTTTTTVTSDLNDGSDDSSGDGEDGPTGPIFLPSP